MQGNELLASVVQTSGRTWCAEGAGQTQRWVSSVREHAEGRYAQTSAGCIGGERHKSQCAHSQELDVLEFDEYTEELLEVSRQVELDFMSRLGVHRKRPRTWATDSGTLSIPTRWLDVSKEDAKQPKYRWRLCGKEIKRWELAVPGKFASKGPLEYVMFLCSKAMTWQMPRTRWLSSHRQSSK